MHGVTLAGIGIALGVPASLVTTRALESLLFGVTPTDAPTLVVVCMLLLCVAMLAALLPARRAQRVDPMLVLRSE
jgi:ABC-type antimicrobial peptide transport system permease subunit